jgi:putative spermidine/putrescine transport system substrate-binding protein
MNRKLIAFLSVFTALSLPVLAAEPITVVSWGGAYQDSVRKAFFEPFMKETGGKVVEEEFNGEIAKVRAMVESGNVTWDVVENDSQTTMASCAEGIVEKIDWQKLGLKRDDFISADASECVVPSILYSTVLAYDTTKVKAPPTSIKAFFDLENYPGS